MADLEAGSFILGSGQEPRFDAHCQLCSRLAGQMVSGVFVHHPDCAQAPVFVGGRPRCCECGGSLYFEQTSIPMSSAADREAARHYRPTR